MADGSMLIADIVLDRPRSGSLGWQRIDEIAARVIVFAHPPNNPKVLKGAKR